MGCREANHDKQTDSHGTRFAALPLILRVLHSVPSSARPGHRFPCRTPAHHTPHVAQVQKAACSWLSTATALALLPCLRPCFPGHSLDQPPHTCSAPICRTTKLAVTRRVFPPKDETTSLFFRSFAGSEGWGRRDGMHDLQTRDSAPSER